MKNLIVCTDGTWNRSESKGGPNGEIASTNVAKIAATIAAKTCGGVEQLTCYIEGVGTRHEESLSGGAFGWGLSRNILIAYDFLCRHYEPGDRIYLFGFSRGAYTARSLVGLIHNSGIVRDKAMIPAAFALYREKNDWAKPGSVKSRIFRAQNSHEATVEFLGVWDTVGTLGIPGMGQSISKLLGWDSQFHDTTFRGVRRVRHALAIHERRRQFLPTTGEGEDCIERWFAGVHSDVGGGYYENGLSNIALEWMVKEAGGSGLGFIENWKRGAGGKEGEWLDATREAGLVPELPPYRRHDSWSGFYKFLDHLAGRCHEGVRIPGELDPSVHVMGEIFNQVRLQANSPWTRWEGTVVAGERYRISVSETAEVKDASIRVSDCTVGIMKPTVVQRAFSFFKRARDLNYMQLVAVINRHPSTVVAVSANPFEFEARQSGTLEFYLNDVPGFYGNNSGELALTIERIGE